MSNVLKQIQRWYFDQCNGTWEKDYGIKIETLDNPGWYITIDLSDTKLESLHFTPIKMEKNENDWIHCWFENKQFHSACGPHRLHEVFEIFLDWVESAYQKNN